MALSESMAAYTDCYEIYDAARDNPQGVRVLIGEYSQAGIMRMRMNQARVLERKEAKRLYDRTDPKYGKSENDKFQQNPRRHRRQLVALRGTLGPIRSRNRTSGVVQCPYEKKSISTSSTEPSKKSSA